MLDFSNRTFQDFVADSVELDIYEPQYHHASGSKANRLRGFWKAETDELVGKLILDLVEYAEVLDNEADSKLLESCRATGKRLMSEPATDIKRVTNKNTEDKDSQPIRVFISYSWDSEEHKDWVREFADELAANGIEIALDQYGLGIGDDRFQFMEASVRDADTVLCICTPAYVQKANGRASGVGVETSLITPQFYDRMKSAKQFIPVVRSFDADTNATPDYLSALIYVDFQIDDQFEPRMQELLRHLHRQPKHRKPKTGSRPNFS